MFCPNCGEKLKVPNQRFCPNCGSEIPTISESPQLKTERSQYASTTRSQSTTGYTDFLVKQRKLVEKGRPGPHSKKCLGFGIASIVLAIFDLIFGFSIFLLSILFFDFNRMVIELIIVILIHFVGLVFGILSRINSAKAGKSEQVNAVEQVGSVFGVIGIVINAILVVIAFFILPGINIFASFFPSFY